MNFIRVTDDELNKMQQAKGNKFEWGPKDGNELSSATTFIGNKSRDCIGYKNSPVMFKCNGCQSHFFLEGCPNCGNNHSMEFKWDLNSGDQYNFDQYLRCHSCGHTSSVYWTCPECNTQNLFTKNKPYIRTVYSLNKKSNCFIATACYGSYDTPEVMVLRTFRDQVLLNSLPGKIFVEVYYHISPPIANFIQKRETFKAIIRSLLIDPLIRSLKDQNRRK